MENIFGRGISPGVAHEVTRACTEQNFQNLPLILKKETYYRFYKETPLKLVNAQRVV